MDDKAVMSHALSCPFHVEKAYKVMSHWPHLARFSLDVTWVFALVDFTYKMDETEVCEGDSSFLFNICISTVFVTEVFVLMHFPHHSSSYIFRRHLSPPLSFNRPFLHRRPPPPPPILSVYSPRSPRSPVCLNLLSLVVFPYYLPSSLYLSCLFISTSFFHH